MIKPIQPFLVSAKCKSIIKQNRIKMYSLFKLSTSIRFEFKISYYLINSSNFASPTPMSSTISNFPECSLASPTRISSYGRNSLSFNSGASQSMTIDDFDLVSLIGEGAFGKVLMVRYKKTSKVNYLILFLFN